MLVEKAVVLCRYSPEMFSKEKRQLCSHYYVRILVNYFKAADIPH